MRKKPASVTSSGAGRATPPDDPARQGVHRDGDVIVYDYLSNAESSRGPSPAARKSTRKKSKDHAFPGRNQPAPHRQGEGGQDRDPAEGRRPRSSSDAAARRPRNSATPAFPSRSCPASAPPSPDPPTRRHPRHPPQPLHPAHHLHRTRGSHEEESSLDYAQIAKAPGTKVMLMGVERLPIITAAILKEGGDPELPVALVRWAPPPAAHHHRHPRHHRRDRPEREFPGPPSPSSAPS